jgi:hypothetical protein
VLVKEANAEKYRDMWDSRGNGSGNEVIVMAEMDLKGGIGFTRFACIWDTLAARKGGGTTPFL